MDSMRHALHSIFKATAESVLPPLATSQFEEKRVLTPQEFVTTGDYLVRACPTWSWEGGDAKKRKPYLPADKQFLITRNVPCMRRATDIDNYDPNSEFVLEGDEEGWVATHNDPAVARPAGAENDDIPEMDEPEASAGVRKGGEDGDDDIPDIGSLEMEEEDDEAAIPSTGAGSSTRTATATATAHQPLDSNTPGGSSSASTTMGKGAYLRAVEPCDDDGIIRRTRTYDLHITYDQFYQVPRFWLVGYDESRQPLLPPQVMEDVSEEHARKTITVDPHPHLPISAASIHPCRHAEVMKKFVDQLQEAGRSFALEQYLVLFLKFIASVVPTIQYDYTMSVGNE